MFIYSHSIVATTRFVEVKLRDRIEIVGDIYYRDSPSPYPRIIHRTPYGRDFIPYSRAAKYFSSNGFDFLDCCIRVSGNSEETSSLTRSKAKKGRI